MCIWEEGARLRFVGKHHKQRTMPSSLESLAPRPEITRARRSSWMNLSAHPASFSPRTQDPRSSPPATHALTHSADGGRVRDVCS